MKVGVIAELISKARANAELRSRIVKGDFPVELGAEERRVVRETVLRLENGEVVPDHLAREDDALVWMASRLN